ncbi:MAG: hypothetical protein M1817_006714 [Caeruleum heppii]|nr:MAG: hypothetical protein M1817_006714 [Caeruleum heppii]
MGDDAELIDISDDSSFYGDDDHKDDLAARKIKGDGRVWHAALNTAVPRGPSTAVTESPSLTRAETPKLYNPYEGAQGGRQLAESVNDFLKRLPPITTRSEEVGPWLWIANPHAADRPLDKRLSELTKEGEEILSRWLVTKTELEKTLSRKSASVITRTVNQQRKGVEEAIVRLARAKNITTGKWMLFPTTDNIPRTWSRICHATVANELGIAAKIATDAGGGNDSARLIGVYTYDFDDMDDVRRVVLKLEEFGFLQEGRGIYYKNDAYTHLGINSGNEWGLKASMYSSKDILEHGTKKRKL